MDSFLDEARLSARIRHPNVLPALDVMAVDGELFIVMDFVNGDTWVVPAPGVPGARGLPSS